MITLHKLHDRAATLCEEAGQHARKVACPGAVQWPGLLQNREEIRQQVAATDQSVKDAIDFTAEDLYQHDL